MEDEIDRMIRLGIDNRRIIDLARDHCLRMEFVADGGHGMLEEQTGLPIDRRRVQCPLALGTSAMRLDQAALSFYRNHCIGCSERQPTGRIPNLSTEYDEHQERAAHHAAARARKLEARVAAWGGTI